MANRYLIVVFTWRGIAKIKEMEPVFDKGALDWMRVSPDCWIVWSGATADDWLTYLKPHMRENDSIFICDLNASDLSKYAGWQQKWIWEWFQKSR